MDQTCTMIAAMAAVVLLVLGFAEMQRVHGARHSSTCGMRGGVSGMRGVSARKGSAAPAAKAAKAAKAAAEQAEETDAWSAFANATPSYPTPTSTSLQPSESDRPLYSSKTTGMKGPINTIRDTFCGTQKKVNCQTQMPWGDTEARQQCASMQSP